MRMIRRTLAGAALALPLTAGAAGIASADTVTGNEVQAGPDGAATHSVQANAGRAGGSYHENTTVAGRDGVATADTSATGDGHGNAQFRQRTGSAAADGVSSSDTRVKTGGVQPDQGVLAGTLNALGL
jgi:hypothetical protein